jgi:hypothetical protein
MDRKFKFQNMPVHEQKLRLEDELCESAEKHKLVLAQRDEQERVVKELDAVEKSLSNLNVRDVQQ